jgi:hypothetical protein
VTLDRCDGLRGRIAEKKRLEQHVTQIRRFKKVRDLLTQHLDRLAPLRSAWHTLRNACIADVNVRSEAAPAFRAIDAIRQAFKQRPEAVIEDRVLNPVVLGQTLQGVADALERALVEQWQRHTTRKVPPANREVLDALAPAFRREVQLIRQLSEHIDRFRQILPVTPEQLQEFDAEVAELQRVWGQLGGGEMPAAVLLFLKAAAAPAGAGIDLLTEEVRSWLNTHRILRSFAIRVSGSGA